MIHKALEDYVYSQADAVAVASERRRVDQLLRIYELAARISKQARAAWEYGYPERRKEPAAQRQARHDKAMRITARMERWRAWALSEMRATGARVKDK